MKRILFIIPFLSSGGAERVVSIWSSELAKIGKDIHLLVFYRVDNEYKVDKNVVIHTIRNTKEEYESISKLEKIKEIRRIFKCVKPNIAIPFVTYVGILVNIAKTGLPIKVVETIRIDPRYSPQSRIFRFIRDISVCISKRCIVQNKDQLLYFPKFIQKKIGIFPNPISNDFISQEKIFSNNKINNIVAVGRLEEQKNFKLLIKSFSNIIGENKELNLKIYGEGKQKESLDNYIKELGLQKYVQLCGRTNNIVEELKKSDLYILSSNAEGMPNSLMEAMALGLPCISTNCPTGPSDLIVNELNGILVPIKDEEKLTKAIEFIVNNPEESIKMGKNARKSIIERYSPNISANNVLEYLNYI